MQICNAITTKSTFAIISKTNNDRTMNFVSIHMFFMAKKYNDQKSNLLLFIKKKQLT